MSEQTAPTYPVGTIFQMADIPVEAEARFLAELPDMLAEIRRVRAIMGVFNAAFDGELAMKIEGAGDPTWIDDDLGIGTVSVALPGGDSITAKRSLRTGAPSHD